MEDEWKQIRDEKMKSCSKGKELGEEEDKRHWAKGKRRKKGAGQGL